MGEQRTIPLSTIRENPNALRGVDRKDSAYVELVDSIRARGVLQPILVRQLPSQDGLELFGLVDGLHRYTGSLDAGKTEIPVHVLNMDDLTAMKTQLIGNIQRVETKPAQYSTHLKRILASDPLMTKAALATSLNKSEAWLSERLSLDNLDAAIGKLVDDGRINLTNAYTLARLPKEEQTNWVDRAMTETPQAFQPMIAARKKELELAKRQGRDPNEMGFQPYPRLQKVSDMKAESENPVIGPVLVRENNLTTAEQGFAMGVKWAINMDPRSIEIARAKDEQKKKEMKNKKENAAIERAQKRAQDAAEASMKVQEEVAVNAYET